jgi:hypothetical protein
MKKKRNNGRRRDMNREAYHVPVAGLLAPHPMLFGWQGGKITVNEGNFDTWHVLTSAEVLQHHKQANSFFLVETTAEVSSRMTDTLLTDTYGAADVCGYPLLSCKS